MNAKSFYFLFYANLSLFLIDILSLDEFVRMLMLQSLSCVRILWSRSCSRYEEGSLVHTWVVMIVQKPSPVSLLLFFEGVVLLCGQMVPFHKVSRLL